MTKARETVICTARARNPLSRSIEGMIFNSSERVWRIATAQDTAVFNFNNLAGVTDELRTFFQDAFATLLLSNAPERLARLLGRLRSILKFLTVAQPTRCIAEFTANDLRNYAGSLPSHQEYFLRQAKEILLAWAKTGVSGLSPELLLYLPKLEAKHHEVGRAVRTMDPRTGPLNDIEYEAVVSAVRESFALGKMYLADYVLILLAITLGARPMQLAMIKVKDLSIAQRTDGSKVHFLQITRLKQGKNIRPRSLFRARQLSSSIGPLVEQQAAAASAWAEDNGIEIEEAPLFPSTSSALQRRRVVLPSLLGHHIGKSMGTKITRILGRLKVMSDRTGEPIELFQTRLRRTLGTRAAAEGLSAPVIADLMDHSWLDSSLVYIEARPEMIERIDKALALTIAPLAQAFAGTVASRTNDKGQTHPMRMVHVATSEKLESAGLCGKFDFCGLAAPLACYTCKFFNPWLDDVHEMLLDQLVAEREDLLRTTDARVAAVNDRTIFAIAEVVNRCRSQQPKE